MLARYLSGQQLRQLPLLDRFKVREGRVRKNLYARTEPKPLNPQPFQPFKSQITGRWMPPRLSLRRQAQLGKSAYKEGRFEELTRFMKKKKLLQGVKLGKMKERIEEMEAAQRNLVDSSSMPVTLSREQEASSSVVDEVKMTARETRLYNETRAIALAKALAATRGPYTGRSLRNIFKGTKAERDAPGKRRKTAEKLSTMEKTIETWRKTRAEGKNKSRPSLPF